MNFAQYIEQATSKETSGILLYNKGTKQYLILRAYKNWSVPKGMIDDGENSKQAAIRELKEETGITAKGNLEFLGKQKYKKGNKILHLYKMEIDSKENPKVKLSNEHHAYSWVSKKDLKKLHEAQGELIGI